MESRSIALDHHSSAQPCLSALERMQASFGKRYSLEDKNAHEEAIYELIGANRDDLFAFTSSAAEAVAQVIWTVFSEKSRKEGKTQLITSCIEDAPTLQMLKRCEELGCSVKIAPVDAQGRIDLKSLQELISPRTALISLTLAHGLTGVIQPVEEVGRIAKEKGVLLHLDASYALGKTFFSFQESSADYLTFSGERIHSVISSAGVFAKKGRPLLQFVLGSVLDFPSLSALAAAARLATLSLDAIGLETARLRDRFEKEIEQKIPDAKILFQDVLRLPNTTVISFPRVHADALLYFLERKGIYPNRFGVYTQNLTSLLSACGMQEECALSFSLSRMTTEEEVIRAVDQIQKTVEWLRGVSEDLF